jgi:hypothetical protein
MQRHNPFWCSSAGFKPNRPMFPEVLPSAGRFSLFRDHPVDFGSPLNGDGEDTSIRGAGIYLPLAAVA